MLHMYNESSQPWKIDFRSRITVISRHVRGQDGARGALQRETGLSILMHRGLIRDKDLMSIEFNRTILSEKVRLLAKGSANVFYNEKSFRPVITTNPDSYTTKQILLGTILLKGRKITNVKIHKCYLLETYTRLGEMSFVMSFNDMGVFGFDLYDPSNPKESSRYTFSVTTERGLPVIQRTVKQVDLTNHKSSEFTAPTRFRPSRPTYAILCLDGEQNALMKEINEKQHQIFILRESDRIEDVINDMRNSGYHAASLYANTTKYGLHLGLAQKKYTDIINRMNERFKLVNIITTNGIVKHKN